MGMLSTEGKVVEFECGRLGSGGYPLSLEGRADVVGAVFAGQRGMGRVGGV
jgi:hypothetical protein